MRRVNEAEPLGEMLCGFAARLQALSDVRYAEGTYKYQKHNLSTITQQERNIINLMICACH